MPIVGWTSTAGAVTCGIGAGGVCGPGGGVPVSAFAGRALKSHSKPPQTTSRVRHKIACLLLGGCSDKSIPVWNPWEHDKRAEKYEEYVNAA